ncbi:hypothetical protein EJB05_53544, partial [Eragrostis curvula]
MVRYEEQADPPENNDVLDLMSIQDGFVYLATSKMIGCTTATARVTLAAVSQDGCPIDALGEDLLLEIFLRLPSLATLVHAALTCRAWRRAVASSPSFRRRFRELHRAPLLGVFADRERAALPVFAAAHQRDRDVLAASGHGDFALTSILDPDGFAGDVPLSWRVSDCRQGYLLLLNWDAGSIAVVNPLCRKDHVIIRTPSTQATEAQPVFLLTMHLLYSDEDPTTIWLLCVFFDESKVQAVAFSSDSWDWFHHPWVEVVQPHDAIANC